MRVGAQEASERAGARARARGGAPGWGNARPRPGACVFSGCRPLAWAARALGGLHRRPVPRVTPHAAPPPPAAAACRLEGVPGAKDALQINPPDV